MFLGIFLAVLAYWSKTVEILIAPVIAVVKSKCRMKYKWGVRSAVLLLADEKGNW